MAKNRYHSDLQSGVTVPNGDWVSYSGQDYLTDKQISVGAGIGTPVKRWCCHPFSITDQIQHKGTMKERKEPSGGIYFERKVFRSTAYISLSKNARMVLLAMLDARQTNPAFKKKVRKGFRAERYIDLDKISMTYKQLTRDYGIPSQSIPRALDDLLARGFIEIKHRGGAGEHDKSIYALIEDYHRWESGKVFRQRPIGAHRGFQKPQRECLGLSN